MKISISQDYYTHIIDLVDNEDPEKQPEIAQVVDAILYLLTFYYNEEKVMAAARKWSL